jgi:Xaa-Pro aminopeptidase
VGDPTAEMVDHATQIIEIQDAQFAAMKPGVVASEVDAIVREAMLGNGLKASYTNITGYSLGYYQLFTSRSSDFSYVFRPTDSWVLKPGMVFHMYTVAKGMAFSETVLVTDTGIERLTRTQRSILATTSCEA